jgi:3-hydroxyisobutyrate dehydrogenase-like beta-hydroxyacid dehydrogenase
LQAIVIGDSVGKASALKMCYAAYSKGTTALLCGVLAAAEELGIRGELEQEWSKDEAGFVEQARERVRRVTAKAWRFEGEMAEIADTFREAGLPNGFHAAAGEIYHRLAGYKDAATSPSLEEVLTALHGS